jgi:hypothetical protein
MLKTYPDAPLLPGLVRVHRRLATQEV